MDRQTQYGGQRRHRQIGRQGQTYREKVRQTNRRSHRQTDRQTDRQTRRLDSSRTEFTVLIIRTICYQNLLNVML